MDEAIGSTFPVCKFRIWAFARTANKGDKIAGPGSVSYTHLTLPTIYSV